jgi:hypothetical protein
MINISARFIIYYYVKEVCDSGIFSEKFNEKSCPQFLVNY